MGVAVAATEFAELLVGGIGFLAGVALTAHGLFDGIETAVAAGTTDRDRALRTEDR